MKSVYQEWVQYRAKTKIVSMKTIEEDIGIWKRFLQDSEIADMQIAEIKPKHLLKLFQRWTGNGLITRKDFNNRKSLLNGIFRYAVLNEIIPYNPITSLPCNELKFKCPTSKEKGLYCTRTFCAACSFKETGTRCLYIGDYACLLWDIQDW